jgi:IclR family transcriptional regulator, blcABC operon repressor
MTDTDLQAAFTSAASLAVGADERSSSERSPAVQKAAVLLEVLSRHQRPMSVSDVAREAGTPKSSAHSLLATMTTAGLVYRVSSTRDYVLGSWLVELASRFLEGNALVELFTDAARDFVQTTSQTVQLGRLEGTEVVYLARVEGGQPLQLASRVGTRIPASTTAMGKAALSMLTTHDIRRRYHNMRRLPVMTDHSIRTINALLQEVEKIRKGGGLAIDNEESGVGLRCFGVPLFELSGLCYAASTTLTASGHSATEEKAIADALMALRAHMRSNGRTRHDFTDAGS